MQRLPSLSAWIALSACIALSGCLGEECDTRGDLEHVERLGSIAVHESVRIDSCFLEQVFEHVVTVRTASGQARELGRYRNEEPSARTHIARAEGVLAITSGASLYLVDLSAHPSLREAPVHEFMPAQALDISRWGDVNYEHAPAFSIDDSTWTLRYESSGSFDSEVEPIEFVSHDRGAHFVLRAQSSRPAQEH